MTIREIRLDAIHNNPFQKRHHYENIPDLARTIAVDGLQQIPKARHNGDGVQLKFGHRRAQAFRWLRENWEKEKLPNRYDSYTVMPLDIEDLIDEQMFRGATIENNQRADLSPIEKMEEMKAWVEFGYNSKQIAEMYPGMSDSTVRGLLYFDQLIPEAKDALHKGEITQGAARDILSLQRVSSPNVVKGTIEKVKAGAGKWGQEMTPKEIIMDEIEELHNVVTLVWNASDKKPTVKDHGWALDLKNFPNHLLPELAMADTRTALESSFEIKLNSPTDSAALSDAGREDLALKLEHLINPPSCGACQFMTKFNDRYYCGIKQCYERKVIAWQRYGLQVGGKKLGIDIYDRERDGEFLVLQAAYQNQKHADLWKKKNKDLRLAFMADIDRKKYQSGYDECPSGCVVIVVGGTLKKLLTEKEEAREERRVDMTEFRRERMEKHHNELLWESTLYLKVLLDGMPDDAVMSLYDAPRYGWDRHSCIPEDKYSGNEDLKVIVAQTRREIALNMLIGGDEGVDDDLDAHETLAELAADIQKRAKAWRVKLPAEFAKRAAQYDAEIAEAVATETARRALLHQGKQNRIDRWKLVEQVFGEPVPLEEQNDGNLLDRDIRYAVGRLREEGHLICDMGDGAGRWMAATEKEFWDFYGYYIKPINSTVKKARAMKKAALQNGRT